MTPTATKAREIAPEAMEGTMLPDPTPSIHYLIGRIIDELPAIGKTQKNEQQNFMFRGHDDVMNALNPLLGHYGVFVMPDVVERISDQRTTSRNSTMYEVNLHVRFRFYGPGGDYVEASGWGEGTDMGDKATSKAMTMAFKYVVAQVFAVSTSETIDADSGTAEETSRGPGSGSADRTASPARNAPLTDWATINGSIEAYGDPCVYATWKHMLAELSVTLWGVEDSRQLDGDQRKALFKHAKAAAEAIRSDGALSGMPPPGREWWVEKFAKAAGGDLAGPPWRLSPEETDRPTFEEHSEQGTPAEGVDPDYGDIPFD